VSGGLQRTGIREEEGGRRDRKEKMRRGERAAGISSFAALDVGLSNLLNSHHSPTALTDFPSQE